MNFCFKNPHGLFDSFITFHDFELIVVVKLQRCLQREEMFLAVIAFQGLGNLLGAALDLRMLELGQLDAVAFAGKDRAQDTHARQTGDITDDPVDLNIHLCEGLLHALHQAVAVLAQSVSQPKVTAYHAHLSLGTKGASEHPEGVELLQPLTVFDVGLAARNVLDMFGID